MKIFCDRETVDERHRRLENWHPFFAILPRWDGVQCWHVGWIERKGKYSGYYGGWSWQYRELDLERYP